MEWSQEKTLQFIECYRSYPFLWDSKHEFYKNKIKRHDALLEIAAKFEVEKVEVERKIKNLQSHFLREKKKEKDNKKSGSAADESFSSKWFAYKSLFFLSSRNKPRKGMDSQMIDHTAEDSLGSTAGSTQSSEERPKRQRNVENVNEKLSNAYSIMTEVYKNRSNKDEFSLFGDQVAIKLRKISCPYARVNVQNKINTLLLEGELGVYDSYGYSRRESETSNSQNITASSTFIPTPIRSENSESYHSDCSNRNFAISDDVQDSDQRIFTQTSHHFSPSSTYIPTPISGSEDATDSNCVNSYSVPNSDQQGYFSMNYNQPTMNDEDNSQATQLSVPESMEQHSREMNEM